MLKQKIYNSVVMLGIRVISKIFPEYFASEPLNACDRYIEYHFAISNLPDHRCHILDVGCSGSMFPLLLSAMGNFVVGIDLRSYPIAKEVQFLDFTFLKDDISKPNKVFTEETFDVITCISTLEHIGLGGRHGVVEAPWADFSAMRNIWSYLKKNGILILTVPFGKYQIVRPFHKIYDYPMLRLLIEDFAIKEMKFYSEYPYTHEADYPELYNLPKTRPGFCCMVLVKT